MVIGIAIEDLHQIKNGKIYPDFITSRNGEIAGQPLVIIKEVTYEDYIKCIFEMYGDTKDCEKARKFKFFEVCTD